MRVNKFIHRFCEASVLIENDKVSFRLGARKTARVFADSGGDQKSRARIAGALGDLFNVSKIMNCSHVIVFGTYETPSNDYLDEIHAREG